MITYEGICEKLGFDAVTYKSESKGTEYDGEENPFKILSLEELDFLGNYMREYFKKNERIEK